MEGRFPIVDSCGSVHGWRDAVTRSIHVPPTIAEPSVLE
jgi:hypothetical protein